MSASDAARAASLALRTRTTVVGHGFGTLRGITISAPAPESLRVVNLRGSELWRPRWRPGSPPETGTYHCAVPVSDGCAVEVIGRCGDLHVMFEPEETK